MGAGGNVNCMLGCVGGIGFSFEPDGAGRRVDSIEADDSAGAEIAGGPYVDDIAGRTGPAPGAGPTKDRSPENEPKNAVCGGWWLGGLGCGGFE
jgi:hypothetical protein